jgi:UDP-glucose 4-epimerase
MKYKRLLVVGGAGFVGSHLVDVLVEQGAEKVVVVDNMFLGKMENLSWARQNGNVVVYKEDARYLTALENIIEREKPEVIFNLAVKCLPYGFVDPEGSFMTGVEIAHNLANLLRKRKYERLLHFSSSEAYGTAVKVPMDENHPLNPNSPYGAGKAAADLFLLSYYKLFDLEISILRPFNLYGERQNMQAYAAVVPVTIWRILNGQRPILEGDGLQTRDFTYVKDVAEIALKMMECDKTLGRIVNTGQGKETDIKTVVSMICDELNYPLDKIDQKPPRPSDVRRLLADTTLARKLLGYSAKTSLEEGIKLTIDWFRSEKNNTTSRPRSEKS